MKNQLTVISATIVFALVTLSMSVVLVSFLALAFPKPRTFNTTHIFDLQTYYMIKNPCTTKNDISGIHVVVSSGRDFKARDTLREVYPQEELTHLGVYRVFLLAMFEPADYHLQGQLFTENDKHQDIVQGNFLDVDGNLTYKSIMGLRWAVMECRMASYVMKTNIDTLVDMYGTLELIKSSRDSEYDLMGHLLYWVSPHEDKRSKWYVTEEEFEGDMYPEFLTGDAYVVKMKSAERMLLAMETQRFFRLEEVLVTGILAKEAHLTHEDIGRYYVSEGRVISCVNHPSQDVCDFIVSPIGENYKVYSDFKKYKEVQWTKLKENCSSTSKMNCYVLPVLVLIVLRWKFSSV